MVLAIRCKANANRTPETQTSQPHPTLQRSYKGQRKASTATCELHKPHGNTAFLLNYAVSCTAFWVLRNFYSPIFCFNTPRRGTRTPCSEVRNHATGVMFSWCERRHLLQLCRRSPGRRCPKTKLGRDPTADFNPAGCKLEEEFRRNAEGKSHRKRNRLRKSNLRFEEPPLTRTKLLPKIAFEELKSVRSLR